MPDLPRIYPARERIVTSPGRDLAAELNREQGAAATHGDGPLLIIAGAGTGKTRTLVYRVAHLIDRGVPPERILLLTFTRRAAQEMLSRAERLVGSASSRVHGGTFHATGHRLLRQFGPDAGLARDFSIMDQGDAEDLVQLARNALGFGKHEKRFPKKETLHYIYSRFLNTERPVETIVEQEFPQFVEFRAEMLQIFGEYTNRKAERNLVDYDDLLFFWAQMLEQSPALADRIAGRYDHVLVDEYQDTNVLQARILRGMCRTHRNITVVGDDAQSIYSFRGASFRNILDFPKQFADTAIVALEQNYRSTQPILDVTNTLISRALERFTKQLWTLRTGTDAPWLVTARDEQQQTRFVVDRILELHEEGVPLHEMAVLVRAGYMSADLEIELTNRKIPFEKWGGLKFLEAAHVKDVLAFLRVLENPRDEVSWYRILMLMPGIGDVTARAMMESMAERSWDANAFSHFAPPPKARDAHRELSALLKTLRRARDADGSHAREGAVGEDIDAIRALYDSILGERYDRSEPRMADLDQLRVIAAGYPSRAAFLAALALEPPSSTQDLAGGSDSDDDALVISTAHSAKGKEWDAVFVIWAVDGWFPSSRSLEDEDQLEEERRLMYVALTRAKNHLAVTYPLNVYATRRGADYSIDQLSRFIDRGVREKMQRVVPQDSANSQAPAIAPTNQSPHIDLRSLLRGRFGGGGGG
ncbi:MAG TPA: ATP-dependent helicase [Gemmatimonadaceae bacterium]|jgi:DNA helicase-2/ATP-dependent DNA helicase PcrA|nr:ATP-dependent helicase [Gemmatimonadaceae bacterium]